MPGRPAAGCYDGAARPVHEMTHARMLALLVLLAVSGACGLAYQVLWLRELSLVFGATVYAASTVLAAFMGGMALGAAAAGRLTGRLARPLTGFGLAEVGIGLAALGVATVFGYAEPLDAALHHLTGGATATLTLARFLAALALLVVPTSLMGLTLPLVCASPLVRQASGSRLSLVYGVNTAGGVVGAAIAGFVAIPAVGAGTAMRITATLSVLIGVGALLLARYDREQGTGSGERGEQARGNRGASPVSMVAVPTRALGLSVALSGAAAMALEVLWFRALLQFVPATTYAFTTMLAVVLVGLALGSLWASRLLRRDRDWLGWLVHAHLLTGLAALASLTVLAYGFDRGLVAAGPAMASALAMLPAAIGMGATLPVTLHVAALGAREAATVATRVGRLYALNVAGAVVGAVATGFWLIPGLGVRHALALASAAFPLIAIVLARASRQRIAAPLVTGLALFAALAVALPDPLDLAFARRHGSDRPPLWRDEGPQATVSVHGDGHSRQLFIDGLTQASDRPEAIRVHRDIGHLAMLLHRDPRDVLVIGLGGGATAGAVSRHGARLSIVELNEGVRRAAPWFAGISYDVLRQPSTRLVVDDARSFLATTDERFDVVTADIIQPTHAGAGALYSREYFSRVRARLKPGGLVLQWVGLREDSAYKLIARTFQSVFPETTAWDGGTLLVGTLEPLTVSRAAVARQLARPETREALTPLGLVDFEAVMARYSAGPDELRAFLGDGPLLTDDRPLVEFYRALPAGEGLVPLAQLHGSAARVVAP